MFGARAAWGCQVRSAGSGWPSHYFLRFAAELAAHAGEGLDQLEPRALGGGRTEDGLGVFQPGVRAERYVAKAQHRKKADAGLEAAASKYSEHRRSLGRVAQRGEVLGER